MNRVAGLAGGGIVVALLAGGVGLYVGRGSIAESAARKWLTDHGVAASAIEIEGLSPNGFTARLRLGAAGDPDLTVEHMDVRYDLMGPWSGSDLAINPRSVRLVGLRLQARLSHGVVSLGAVDKVIKAIEQLPPSKAPPPAIFLQDGEVRLVSDGGVVRLHGAGRFSPGAASNFHGQLAPFHLAFDGQRFDGAGGIVSVASNGGRLTWVRPSTPGRAYRCAPRTPDFRPRRPCRGDLAPGLARLPRISMPKDWPQRGRGRR